jgi:hypothetical protein
MKDEGLGMKDGGEGMRGKNEWLQSEELPRHFDNLANLSCVVYPP